MYICCVVGVLVYAYIRIHNRCVQSHPTLPFRFVNSVIWRLNPKWPINRRAHAGLLIQLRPKPHTSYAYRCLVFIVAIVVVVVLSHQRLHALHARFHFGVVSLNLQRNFKDVVRIVDGRNRCLQHRVRVGRQICAEQKPQAFIFHFAQNQPFRPHTHTCRSEALCALCAATTSLGKQFAFRR